MFTVQEVAEYVRGTLGSMPSTVDIGQSMDVVKLQSIARTVESRLFFFPGERHATVYAAIPRHLKFHLRVFLFLSLQSLGAFCCRWSCTTFTCICASRGSCSSARGSSAASFPSSKPAPWYSSAAAYVMECCPFSCGILMIAVSGSARAGVFGAGGGGDDGGEPPGCAAADSAVHHEQISLRGDVQGPTVPTVHC